MTFTKDRANLFLRLLSSSQSFRVVLRFIALPQYVRSTSRLLASTPTFELLHLRGSQTLVLNVSNHHHAGTPVSPCCELMLGASRRRYLAWVGGSQE